MDKGCDYKPTYKALDEHHVAAVVCLNKAGKARDGNRRPTCKHGDWVYLGADHQRGKGKWACPDGLCGPKVQRLDPDRFNPIIPRSSDAFREHYEGRTEIEREFGRLKRYGGLQDFLVRRIDRVRLHIDLCILTRLGLALAERL